MFVYVVKPARDRAQFLGTGLDPVAVLQWPRVRLLVVRSGSIICLVFRGYR